MREITITDSALLGYIIDRIQGRSGPTASDKTIFIFEGGAVCGTIPATPDAFRDTKFSENCATCRRARLLPVGWRPIAKEVKSSQSVFVTM
jgi:hypothetical protein